ncbi:hypothetical protein CYR32_07475 [Chimaeribacter coloradensis]|uniref:Uncharacterized protein n=2 Tax=Chimaeribacter coloradensis TaxID=2060068 RepID=A0A2N5E826_9GAMM|nr:hypothetical protein CYR32_07475 [Chimaeribacter coloradensis]
MDNSYLAKQNILIDSIRIAMELVSGESSLEKAQNSGLFERIDRVSPKQKGRPEIILLRNKNILTISMDRDIEKNELYAANVILNKTAIHSIIFNECNILSSLDLHYRGVKKNKQKIRGRHRG